MRRSTPAIGDGLQARAPVSITTRWLRSACRSMPLNRCRDWARQAGSMSPSSQSPIADASRWDQRYQEGSDGWKLGQPAPPLAQLLRSHPLAPQSPGKVLWISATTSGWVCGASQANPIHLKRSNHAAPIERTNAEVGLLLGGSAGQPPRRVVGAGADAPDRRPLVAANTSPLGSGD